MVDKVVNKGNYAGHAPQCTHCVLVGDRWYQCTCHAGDGHSTSDYDHIVEAVTFCRRVNDQGMVYNSPARTEFITVTWID